VMASVPGKVGIEEYVDNFMAEVCNRTNIVQEVCT
jgi:hypothetical protein